jgi:hypothetical protein
MSMAKAGSSRVIETACTVDLEQTHDSLHAYVALEGIDPGAGDRVIIHDVPEMVGFGEKAVFARRATLIRANAFERFIAHVEGYLELTELFEVSFSDGRA